MIYYVPDDGSSYTPEMKGYRVAVVIAGEDGYRWTGTWPNDGTGVMPYFWGPTLQDAKRICVKQNARMHVTEEEALLIIGRSMARATRSPKRRARK